MVIARGKAHCVSVPIRSFMEISVPHSKRLLETKRKLKQNENVNRTLNKRASDLNRYILRDIVIQLFIDF